MLALIRRLTDDIRQLMDKDHQWNRIKPRYFTGESQAMKDLVTRLPARVNKILDATADNKLGFKLDTGIDAHGFMLGLQTVANRITVGLVLAALIVGAAMLMRIPTSFTIFGYPGLAMLFFLGAVAGGLLLVARIVISDRRRRQEATPPHPPHSNGGP